MGKVLEGAAIAAAIKKEVAEDVRRLAGLGVRPGLAAVLVGNVAASEIYVRSKVQAVLTWAFIAISSLRPRPLPRKICSTSCAASMIVMTSMAF